MKNIPNQWKCRSPRCRLPKSTGKWSQMMEQTMDIHVRSTKPFEHHQGHWVIQIHWRSQNNLSVMISQQRKIRMYIHNISAWLCKSTRLRPHLCFLSIHLCACPRASTATRKLTCALLCRTSLRSAEDLARPARPELLLDQFCDFVLSVADCSADEKGDDRDRHGDNPRCGPKT